MVKGLPLEINLALHPNPSLTKQLAGCHPCPLYVPPIIISNVENTVPFGWFCKEKIVSTMAEDIVHSQVPSEHSTNGKYYLSYHVAVSCPALELAYCFRIAELSTKEAGSSPVRKGQLVTPG